MSESALPTSRPAAGSNVASSSKNAQKNLGGARTGRDVEEAEAGQKKGPRIPGACDICKRKKIRCDSGQMTDNRCSNCVQYGHECTHKAVTKTLGPAKGYVESLETRLEKMNILLSKLAPGVDINQEVERMELLEDQTESQNMPRNDDDRDPESLVVGLSKLQINPEQNRFFGKSSSFQLVLTAIDMKMQYHDIPRNGQSIKPSMPVKRDEVWGLPPWYTDTAKPPVYVYPPRDLMPSLIANYFDNLNTFLPLLHRPTFEQAVADKLYLSNHQFGATLLLVCAHGAKYSDDPRVLMPGYTYSTRTAGWRWYEQVNIFRKTLFDKTTLYELQMHALHVLFAQGSEMPQGVWAHIGVATRLAQEVGAHRKRRRTEPCAENELWKRAFWVILVLDRYTSAFSGRPSGLQDEDFDLDPLIECDDEYWDSSFEQPPTKPSSISYFNSYLRLMDILAYAMRLLYSVRRTGNSFNQTTPRSDQQLIAELDSMMNSWMDSVPIHLKWNQNFKSDLFLKQSATLHATYYHLQIYIHRPFIPTPRNPHPSAFPSLAICTNAARSCCHVLEAFSKLSVLTFAQLEGIMFTAATILLLNVWSGKKSGETAFPRREMEDVQRCMSVLKLGEKHWASAGRWWDALSSLVFKQYSTTDADSTKKRSRDEPDNDTSITLCSSATQVSSSSGSTPSSSSKGGEKAPRLSSSLTPESDGSQDPPDLNFALPFYTTELGSLPIHGHIHFTDPTSPPPGLSSSGASTGKSSLPHNSASANPDSFMFNNFAPSGMNMNAGMSSIPPTADTYVVDALLHGHGHPGPQTQSDFPATNSSQAADTSLTSNFDFHSGSGGLDMLSFAMDYVDFTSLNFAGTSSETMGGTPENSSSGLGTFPGLNDETMALWDNAPVNMQPEEWTSYASNM